MIEFKEYRGKYSRIAADIALKNRLYVSGWQLSGILKEIRNNPLKDTTIGICYLNNKPVSVVVSHRNFTNAFTRKSERRKGLASSIIKELGVPVHSHDYGINGSWYFWKSVTQ